MVASFFFQVRVLLYNACAAERLEWYFNNIRFRCVLPSNQRSLLPTGTTGNEALHAQINSW